MPSTKNTVYWLFQLNLIEKHYIAGATYKPPTQNKVLTKRKILVLLSEKIFDKWLISHWVLVIEHTYTLINHTFIPYYQTRMHDIKSLVLGIKHGLKSRNRYWYQPIFFSINIVNFSSKNIGNIYQLRDWAIL